MQLKSIVQVQVNDWLQLVLSRVEENCCLEGLKRRCCTCTQSAKVKFRVQSEDIATVIAKVCYSHKHILVAAEKVKMLFQGKEDEKFHKIKLRRTYTDSRIDSSQCTAQTLHHRTNEAVGSSSQKMC